MGGDPEGGQGDHAAEGEDGDLGDAPADVDDHAPDGVGDGEAGADAGGHGALEEEDLPRPGVPRGVHHRLLLHLRHAGGDGDRHAGAEEPPPRARLPLGGRVTGKDLAAEIVRAWLDTPFEGGRHQKRIEKIERYEKDYLKEL